MAIHQEVKHAPEVGHCYRDSSYHAGVGTNNGVEAQNKALKYKFLPRKSVSLSCIATIILERFLPEQNHNYLFLNFQMNGPITLIYPLI